ncbi:MAG: peptidylprolyl isomerase FKBP-type [Verrucomicrobia bacterium]|nr:peptidylprolyl isomerase FKBP-type [Verrucomicrobiota bacterium]
MKLKSLLIPSLLAFGVSAVTAQEIKLPGKTDAAAPATPPAAAAAPAAPAATFTEAQVLETIGWFMGKNSQSDTFEFTKDQVASVMRGFGGAVEGKSAPYDLKQIGPQVQAYVAAKQETYVTKLRDKGLQETAAFMAEVKKKPGVQVTPSGLAFEIIKPGEGPAPKPGETVRAHYRGLLANGTEFDNSMTRGEPVEFPLDQVIPGWTEGLQKISKGGKIKLYVPPQLAYGDDGRPGIPPASTLVFEIELLDIKPTPPAPAAPAAGTATPPATPTPMPAK